MSQRQAAAAAGMSKHQEKQAKRVANIPDDVFEALVEGEHPPTITRLAELGTRHIATRRPPATTKTPSRLEFIGRLALIKHQREGGLDGEAAYEEAADQLHRACELYLWEKRTGEKG